MYEYCAANKLPCEKVGKLVVAHAGMKKELQMRGSGAVREFALYGETTGDVDADGFIRYRASKFDCDACALKPKCCPVTPMRKIMRSIHEGARDLARSIAMTDAYLVSHRERKKVEMLFAHLKRILKLDRLRLRGPYGAKDEFHLAAAAQNLRKLAKLLPIPVAAAA